MKAAEERGALSGRFGLAEVLAAPVDLIVIAAPPQVTARLLGEIETSALVIDVTSVKSGLVDAGEGLAHFVATHPMAGREVSGPDAASGSLFEGATWVIASDGADPDDIEVVEGIVVSLGARAVVMTAAEHDAAVARVSHLPQVVAGALMLDAADSPSSLDLAAGSFRDLTRVAASDPSMWQGILAANAAEVVAAIRSLQRRLAVFEAAIMGGGSELYDVLTTAREQRESLGAAAVPVRIALADRPGELAKVGHSLESSGVDVRDLQLRHAPYGGGGVLTISVRAGEADALRSALVAEGLLLID